MKKISLLFSALLLASIVSFAQQTRDHRRNSQKPFTPPPVQPPPVASTKAAGPPVTNIVVIGITHKKAGTEKYLMITGHKDPSRSNAILAIEQLQQDNTSQQWRFIATEVEGSTIYQLQNRKYSGVLFAPRELFLEQPRSIKNDQQKISTFFMMVLNPDKSWYIITHPTGDLKILALSSEIRSSRHCMPAESEPLIGGMVLKDYECSNDSRREYVTQPRFTGRSDQKWILAEAK
ncbi:MAG: hypothetical protein IPK57_02725 [Chitinophagaceae bacterium]|nr:hypothetical protein [Chitinophagaceae bacterium]